MEIKSRFDHYNINVLDLQKSLDFYEKALGLKEVRTTKHAPSTKKWVVFATKTNQWDYISSTTPMDIG